MQLNRPVRLQNDPLQAVVEAGLLAQQRCNHGALSGAPTLHADLRRRGRQRNGGVGLNPLSVGIDQAQANAPGNAPGGPGRRCARLHPHLEPGWEDQPPHLDELDRQLASEFTLQLRRVDLQQVGGEAEATAGCHALWGELRVPPHQHLVAAFERPAEAQQQPGHAAAEEEQQQGLPGMAQLLLTFLTSQSATSLQQGRAGLQRSQRARAIN